MKAKSLFYALLIGVVLTLIIWKQIRNQNVPTRSQFQFESKLNRPTPPKKTSFEVRKLTPDSTQTKQWLAERRPVRDAWLKAADEVALKTGDEQALKIVKMLRYYTALAMPYGDEMVIMENVKSGSIKDGIILVVILPKDTLSGEFWQSSVRESTGASFIPGMKCLIVKKGELLSPLWQGLFLLHEGKHALDYLSSPYDNMNPGVLSDKERDTHEFIHGLVSKIGGRPYEDLVNDEIKIYRERIKKAGGEVGVLATDPNPYPPRLDKIFGPAKSSYEQSARIMDLFFHAYFRLFDQDRPDKAQRLKSSLWWTNSPQMKQRR